MIKNGGKNLLAAIVFVLVFFNFPGPKQANAFLVPVFDPVMIKKEFVLDVVVRSIARRMLAQLSNQIIYKIQTGGRTKDNPAFVQNWRGFILNGQYRGEDVFRGLLSEAANQAAGGKGVICPQFKDQITKVFNADKSKFPNGFKFPQGFKEKRVGSLQDFAVLVKCSLPDNIDNFYKDFSAGGGGETFLRAFEQQNTLSGVLALSLEEIEKQRKIEEQADTNEALSGSGFTGLRSNCQGSIFKGNKDNGLRCTVLGQVVTPPSLLSENVKQTINSEFDWLVNADEISEIIGGVMGAVINRVSNEILNPQKGLAKTGKIPENAEPEPIEIPTTEPIPAGQTNPQCINSCLTREISLCQVTNQACIGRANDTCNLECANTP